MKNATSKILEMFYENILFFFKKLLDANKDD